METLLLLEYKCKIISFGNIAQLGLKIKKVAEWVYTKKNLYRFLLDVKNNMRSKKPENCRQNKEVILILMALPHLKCSVDVKKKYGKRKKYISFPDSPLASLLVRCIYLHV